MAVVVNAIKLRASLSVSHVFVKRLKDQPALANFYAAPAVVAICGIFWIQASLLHGFP